MNNTFWRRTMLHGLIVVIALTVGLPRVAAAVNSAPSGGAGKDGPHCEKRILNVVAHADDDLLFLSPDLLHSVRSGDCVKTVYLTADDAGYGVPRMSEKEAGGRAAYAWMKGVRDSWSETIDERTARWHLDDGSVEIVSLRLPDGGHNGDIPEHRPEGPYDQSGYEVHQYQTIAKLWLRDMDEISNVTDTAAFTFDDLVHAILDEITNFEPTEIRIQDKRSSPDDHPDHACGALFAWEAIKLYPNEHKVTEYRDYDIEGEPENISAEDAREKSQAFFAYAAHDDDVCQNLEQCNANAYGRWLRRQYIYNYENKHCEGACKTAPHAAIPRVDAPHEVPS